MGWHGTVRGGWVQAPPTRVRSQATDWSRPRRCRSSRRCVPLVRPPVSARQSDPNAAVVSVRTSSDSSLPLLLTSDVRFFCYLSVCFIVRTFLLSWRIFEPETISVQLVRLLHLLRFIFSQSRKGKIATLSADPRMVQRIFS